MPRGNSSYRTGEQLRVCQMTCGRVFTGPFDRVETLSKMHKKTCGLCTRAIDRGVTSLVTTGAVGKDSSDLKQLIGASKGVGELVVSDQSL